MPIVDVMFAAGRVESCRVVREVAGSWSFAMLEIWW